MQTAGRFVGLTVTRSCDMPIRVCQYLFSALSLYTFVYQSELLT
jgi:hypothetical protein